MNDKLMLSLIILAVGFLVVLPLIYWFGTRSPKARPKGAEPSRSGRNGRVEPLLGAAAAGESQSDPLQGMDPDLRDQLAELGQLLSGERADPEQGELLDASATGVEPHVDGADEAPVQASGPRPGSRPNRPFDRIVSLFVHARDGGVLRGDDLVVVADKVGLVYGDMGIFHRLVDGREQDGPLFSMANIAKPGSFDLRDLARLTSPGLTFFMTLPGPMPALDAWNSMLPVAQRVAQLLDAELLDESRNPLVEQTVAYIRSEMRQYDRDAERNQIRTRW
ncbi:MAG: cell division protein ZipA [Xanthomonadales bacterium]|nr:cell division protein ZipA [Xanthomonadales bacterium]